MGILKINEANSYLKECLVNTVAEELPDKKLKIEPRLLFLSKEQFDKANNINIKYNVLKILALKFLIIELESVDYIAIIGNNNVKCENDDLEYIDIDEMFEKSVRAIVKKSTGDIFKCDVDYITALSFSGKNINGQYFLMLF